MQAKYSFTVYTTLNDTTYTIKHNLLKILLLVTHMVGFFKIHNYTWQTEFNIITLNFNHPIYLSIKAKKTNKKVK